jgi:FeS assembly SUF system regulator
MIRVSKLGDYAIVLMTCVAERAGAGERPVAARELAQASQLAVPTVAKVCKALAKAGLLVSLRGKAGGFVLARPARDISVAAIVTAIDGPIGLTDCSLAEPVHCALEAACPCGPNWQRINTAVVAALEGVRLDSMITPARTASGTSLLRRPHRGREPSTSSRGAREIKA